MSDINFVCANCGGQLTIEQSGAGTDVTCPYYNHSTRVPPVTSLFTAAPKTPPRVKLPLAYALTLGSFVVLIGGMWLASFFYPGRVLEGAGVIIPLILYTITYIAGLSVWATAKGQPIFVGVLSAIFCGPIGAIILLLLPDKTKERN